MDIKKKSKFVLITGVSSGIGHETALALGAKGYHVLGSVRKKADATCFIKALGDRFTPLYMDVTDAQQVAQAANEVEALINNEGLAALVNNAGIAIPGPIRHISLNSIRKIFEVNVFGVIQVTRAFLPCLGTTPRSTAPGRIINISSIAGRIVFPFQSGYSASKFALEALSDSFRRELRLYGIDVIIIEPGAIATPIWGKGEEIEDYSRTDYKRSFEKYLNMARHNREKSRHPKFVSKTICHAIECKKPKIRYVLPGIGIKTKFFQYWLPQIIPGWLDKKIAITSKR